MASLPRWEPSQVLKKVRGGEGGDLISLAWVEKKKASRKRRYSSKSGGTNFIDEETSTHMRGESVPMSSVQRETAGPKKKK